MYQDAFRNTNHFYSYPVPLNYNLWFRLYNDKNQFLGY